MICHVIQPSFKQYRSLYAESFKTFGHRGGSLNARQRLKWGQPDRVFAHDPSTESPDGKTVVKSYQFLDAWGDPMDKFILLYRTGQGRTCSYRSFTMSLC